jgi:hypothetical protein
MPTRLLSVPVTSFGCPATQARIEVEALTTRQRLARAGSIFGAGLLAALIALPIPIVHFAFVPGALLVGVVLGALRLRHREIFQSAEAPCPCCGELQRLGLAGRVFRLPRAVHCRHCHRSLELGAAARTEVPAGV